MTTYLALIQGVNVGGARKLPMAVLRDVVTAAGGDDVRTYIQSGNVVFTHGSRSPARLRTDLEARLTEAAGFTVSLALRTQREWSALVRANPYPDDEPTTLHVAFLDERPPRGAFDDVDRDVFAPEAFVVRGREIYLHLPNGIGHAKLPPALERAGRAAGRQAPSTTRNWRTVTVLSEMAGGSATGG